MAVSHKLGTQLMSEFEKKKVQIILLDKDRLNLKGTLFTAQEDYLQIDEEHLGKRVTVPFSAIAVVIAM